MSGYVGAAYPLSSSSTPRIRRVLAPGGDSLRLADVPFHDDHEAGLTLEHMGCLGVASPTKSRRIVNGFRCQWRQGLPLARPAHANPHLRNNGRLPYSGTCRTSSARPRPWSLERTFNTGSPTCTYSSPGSPALHAAGLPRHRRTSPAARRRHPSATGSVDSG